MITGHNTFVRSLIARTLAPREGVQPLDYARSRWGASSGAALLLQKAGVGAVQSTDILAAAGGPTDSEFFASVVEGSIAGRARLRMVPANLRLLRPNAAAAGFWVAEGAAIPLSKTSVLGSSLPRRKIGCIIAATLESLESNNPRAEAILEADLRRALIATLDDAFIDADNAGVAGEKPASVTAAATSTATISSGDPLVDLRALVADFRGDLANAVFTSDPQLAAELALWRDSSGGACFHDCGPGGGTLLNLPLITSRNSPRTTAGGQLVLLDGSGIAAAIEAIEIAVAREGALEMADTTAGDSLAPTGADLVPLFQTNTVAFRATIHANWETQRDCVSVITGASYA